MNSKEIKPGIWRHSKTGNLYRVHFVASDADNPEKKTVVYEALYDNPKSKFWYRSPDDFVKIVEIDGQKVPRYVFLREE